MSVMSGQEFRLEQKRRGRLARIPVVVMTAHPDSSVDADLLLSKPFTRADLLSSLARFIPSLRRNPELAQPGA
jgi:CheY-like chemotaxis protein